MIIIKCRYKYCKSLNNEVSKEDAIKINGAYYCSSCYKEKITKQQIEEYYIANLPTTAIQILRKVINQLIHTNNYEAEYVLFILKKIHTNKLKINNPFGLISYCNEGRNITEWKSKKTNEEYKAIKNDLIQYENNKVSYTYKENDRKWTDLI